MGTYGNHPFSETELVRVSERHYRKSVCLYLEESDVSCRVCSHKSRLICLIVVESHFDLGCTFDDMIVCDYISVLTDYDSRTAADLLTLLRRSLLRETEEEIKDGTRRLLHGLGG